MLSIPRSLDDLLLYRLSRLQAVAGGVVVRLCEGRFGITRREWRLVVVLAHHGALGSSRLADEAQLDRARTSRAIGSLVAKALVSRVVASGDRRQVVLDLTPAGRALHGELFPLVAQLHQDLVSVLDAGAAAVLDDALRRMQMRAEALARSETLPKANRRRGGGTVPLRG